jgi:hypothetical protein
VTAEATHLEVVSLPFADFGEQIRRACDAPEGWREPAQVEYLRSYLRDAEMSAQTIVVERPYVDRHYLEEFTAFYATSLHAPRPHITRLHVFNKAPEAIEGLFAEAARGNLKAAEAGLGEAYLGFVGVRPLPSAPIGRTVLKPYGEIQARVFDPASTRYDVHLMGIHLAVSGLPFQQQEQAVGACATTAMWIALSRAARADGNRAPTPYAVTAAANRHLVRDRPLPALAGLDLEQMTAAIREMGHSPYLVKPVPGSFHTFLATVVCYLRSGIPVVLILNEKDQASDHAVTLAGFRHEDDEHPSPAIVVDLDGAGGSRRLSFKGVSRVFVHDDRYGPYMKMTLEASDGDKDRPILKRVTAAGTDAAKDLQAHIYRALIPLYPKLRLTATELMNVAGELQPLFRRLVGPANHDKLSVETRFTLSGRYLREIYELGIDPERVGTFVRSALLSRYVGVVRFFVDGKAVGDVICDTTDIGRPVPPNAPVIGLLAFNPDHVARFKEYAAASAQRAFVT